MVYGGIKMVKKIEVNIHENNDSKTKLINLTGRNKIILELGCASGYISKYLKQNHCTVYAVEIDKEAAKIAKKYCKKLVIEDMESINYSKTFAGINFDVILLGDVLEHLKDPENLLLKIKDLLNNNGYIIISIPNIAHGSIRIKLLNGKFQYSEEGILDKTHLKFFTKSSISHLLEKCGYFIEIMDRTIVDYRSDLDYLPQSLKEEVAKYLYTDSEATTYQFIIKASMFKEATFINKVRKELDQKQIEINDKNIVINKYKIIVEEKDREIKELLLLKNRIKNNKLYKLYKNTKQLIKGD